MPNTDLHVRDLLRLTLTPGLGPVLLSRAVAVLGSPEAVLHASYADLERVKGIGPTKARSIAQSLRDAPGAADEELALAERLGVAIIARWDDAYPPLLRQIPDPPTLLYVSGSLDSSQRDRFPVAIVGSRRCTAYGIEQSERFAGLLARSGLAVISGGARGIDTAAHRGAMQNEGRTVAVLGCGLAQCYPPENRDLFATIGAGAGAVVSELPLRTPPAAENFPARNRIISGMSLGVVVIEAGRRSGALITARQAAEDHGREVMAVPGRVDSAASEGTLELVKSGGAALVTCPADVIEILESPARHHHQGSHESRYDDPAANQSHLFCRTGSEPNPTEAHLTPRQKSVLAAIDQPRTLDELMRSLDLTPAELRAELTLLELRGGVRREGSRFSRTRS
jgi:DNA processing protein